MCLLNTNSISTLPVAMISLSNYYLNSNYYSLLFIIWIRGECMLSDSNIKLLTVVMEHKGGKTNLLPLVCMASTLVFTNSFVLDSYVFSKLCISLTFIAYVSICHSWVKQKPSCKNIESLITIFHGCEMRSQMLTPELFHLKQ